MSSIATHLYQLLNIGNRARPRQDIALLILLRPPRAHAPPQNPIGALNTVLEPKIFASRHTVHPNGKSRNEVVRVEHVFPVVKVHRLDVPEAGVAVPFCCGRASATAEEHGENCRRGSPLLNQSTEKERKGD